MSHKSYLVTILLIFFGLTGLAQKPGDLSNLRKKYIPVSAASIQIDSNSIVPGTFSIPGFPKESYELQESDAVLKWMVKPSIDSVWVLYRVFPFRFSQPVSGLNYDSIRYNFLAEPFTVKTNQSIGVGLFDFDGLQSEGSIGRNISFGNAQDAVVNSSMNLQLHGFIGDSLELSAAITDNNIPIQPEGNTRDLRDFDRILLQIRKKGWQASFGDIDLRYSKSYFLSFYKRLQGVNYSNVTSSGNMLFSGAVAKGKFIRNVLTPLEGNQGPYRLNGANNELYFVVLAGTEKVFIDGELLQRGEDQDYIINYNTAEITFTPKRLIQKDKRIQVEFEYADRNYLNSQLFAQNEYRFNDKLSVNVAAFSNADAKNSAIDQVLDNKQKQFLANIGDSLSAAYYANASPEKYSPGSLLYCKRDTLYNINRHDSVYVLSADTSLLLYNVAFTYLGPGKGNYIPLLNATNGRAFQWIAPDANNNKRGEWEPVTLLVTPKKQQIITASFQYKISEKTTISGEGAFSRSDVNLFSTKDKVNDDGYAVKALLQQQLGTIRIGKEKLEVKLGASFENTGKNFKTVERLRNVEFLRDWSLPFDAGQAKEQLAGGSLSIKSSVASRFRYEGISYKRDNQYEGFKHIVDQYWETGKWKLTGRLNLLDFSANLQKGSFWRPYAEIKKEITRLDKAEFSLKYSEEKNLIRFTNTDSLSPNSFSFHVYEALLKSNQSRLNKWSLSYFRREDELPVRNELIKADKSDNLGISTDLMKNPDHQLRISINYRKLSIIDAAVSKRRPEETLLGRAEYNMQVKKGFLTGNFFYEIGSGQELKREFTYVAVPPGQGEYTWIDYNQNGIEELNEFELAVFQDQKKYIRVFTPGRTYVKANYLQFNYSLDINPRLLFKDGKGIRRILYKSAATSILQINRKELAQGQYLFNPFAGNISDSTLISLSTFFSNSYFYNRSNPHWGLEITHSRAAGKSLLVYGFESRVLENLNSRLRLMLNRSWIANFNYRYTGTDLNNSNPSFRNRNYQIEQQSFGPSFTYIYKSNFRLIFSYNYSQKRNTIDSMEKSASNDLNTELQYNLPSGSSLKANFSINSISWKAYAGSQQTPVGFIMLNGLLPGKNYLWSLDFTKRLGTNLEMNIQYEGRKPSGVPVIHIGRAGVRALF